MRKADLVAAIKSQAKLSTLEADEALAAILDHITNALARRENVNLLGFGSFSVKERSQRQGRHPQTGAEMVIPASQSVHFKPGKALKERLS